MDFSTSDLCDKHAALITTGDVRVLPGQWIWFGAHRRCHGEIVTLQAEGCNGEIRALLGEEGDNRVLVIDAGPSPLALLGDNLAASAGRNGWAGVLINGNVRDVRGLAQVELAIIATGCWPVRSNNERGGIAQAALTIDNIEIFPGDWLYADEDGVLLSRTRLFSSDRQVR